MEEARILIMGAARENGYEAWRMLSISYEPQVGIRRMKELVGLSQLQNKRRKNAAETSMTVVEIDRRKRLIEEIGGPDPQTTSWSESYGCQWIHETELTS